MAGLEATFRKMIVRHEDFTYLVPCADVALYWYGSVFDHADGIVKFYERALEVIKPRIKYFRTETMRVALPLKKDSLGLLPFWLQKTKTKRDIYMLFLESGSTRDDLSDCAFSFGAQPGRGYVRVMLPTSFALESRDEYLALALQLGRTLDFDSGQAGFALNWNWLKEPNRPPVQRMHALARRYPGLDISDPITTRFLAPNGIKGVNWLTFLGAAYVKRLGGKSKLGKSFGSDVIVHDLGANIAIQAGAAPQIGDVNRKDKVPVYHEVGRVLEKVRSKEHPEIFGPGGIPDPEVTEEWLARFDS